MMNNGSYGKLEQSECESQIDLHVEEIKNIGFSIVENILSEDELETYRKKTDKIYQQQEDQLGLEQLISLKEKNMCRMPLKYDDYFINIATKDKVLAIVKRFLGDFFILNLQNCIINTPNEEHHQSAWHRDLPYQNYVISNPLSISALFCLDPFSEKTGGTMVVPNTHKMDVLPSTEYIKHHSQVVNAKAGSAIVFDSMIFHKAGYNSSNIIRRSVNHMYTTPIMKQFYDFPRSLKGRYLDDPFLAQFLGYTSQTALDDVNWRKDRINKNVN